MGKSSKKRNVVEKTTTIFGFFVLAVLVVFLVYQLIQENKKAEEYPELDVTSSYKPEMKDYGFEVKVENVGKESVENAQLKFKFYQDGNIVETGTIEFRYVPVKSKRKAFFILKTKRKTTDSLVISSVTFVKP